MSEHNLTAKFEGDDQHLGTLTYGKVIVEQVDPNLQLIVNSNDSGYVIFDFTSSLEEGVPVTVFANGVEIGVIIVDENGNGAIDAILVEDITEFYASSPATPYFPASLSPVVTINLNKIETFVEINVDAENIKVGQTKTVEVMLYGEGQGIVGEQVEVSVNGTNSVYTTDSGGHISFEHTFTSMDTVQIIATFLETDEYMGCQSTLNLQASRIQPQLSCVSSYNMYRGWYLKIAMTDEEDNPLSNKNILFKVNGILYKKTTDENGIGKLIIRLATTGKFTYQAYTVADDEISYAEISGEANLKNGKVLTAVPTGDNCIGHVKESSTQIDWQNYLGYSSNPFGSTTDEYYARCGKNCYNAISNGSTPAPIYAWNFDCDALQDTEYIESVTVVYTHRYANCTGTPSVGAGTIILENSLTSEGGTVHLERKGSSAPAKNSWVTNEISFSEVDTAITPASLRDKKVTVGIKYDSNEGSTGIVDLGYVGLKIVYSPIQED